MCPAYNTTINHLFHLMHFCVLFDIAYIITKELYLNTFKYNEQNNKKRFIPYC